MAQTRHSLVKAGHDAVEGSQKQIAKALPGQDALGETIAHKLRHNGLSTGQGLHAVANVPGWGHIQVSPQGTGAAAIVCDSYDSGEILTVQLQSAQKRRLPVSAAYDHNLRAFFRGDMIIAAFHSTLLLPGDVSMGLGDGIAGILDIFRQGMSHSYGAVVSAGAADGQD